MGGGITAFLTALERANGVSSSIPLDILTSRLIGSTALLLSSEKPTLGKALAMILQLRGGEYSVLKTVSSKFVQFIKIDTTFNYISGFEFNLQPLQLINAQFLTDLLNKTFLAKYKPRPVLFSDNFISHDSKLIWKKSILDRYRSQPTPIVIGEWIYFSEIVSSIPYVRIVIISALTLGTTIFIIKRTSLCKVTSGS